MPSLLWLWLWLSEAVRVHAPFFSSYLLLHCLCCWLVVGHIKPAGRFFCLIKGLSIVNKSEKRWLCITLKHSFPTGQHMPHPLMTYSSSSSSTGSNDFTPGIKDLRRSSSQISLSSSIQSNVYANVWKVSLLKLKTGRDQPYSSCTLLRGYIFFYQALICDVGSWILWLSWEQEGYMYIFVH